MKNNQQTFVTDPKRTANWLPEFSVLLVLADAATAIANHQHGIYLRINAVQPRPVPLGSRRARAYASARFGMKNAVKK